MKNSNIFQSFLYLFSKGIVESETKENYKRELFRDKKPYSVLKFIDEVNENSKSILERNIKYINKVIEALKFLRHKVFYVDAKTVSRLLIDTSSPFGWLIDEVGLSWHPILDTPFIPVSEIKGAIRTSLLFSESMESSPKINENKIKRLLGFTEEKQSQASLIQFLDALPIEIVNKDGELLEPEVITPMYKDPFEHKTSPTPVFFITVAKGVKFRFVYAIDERRHQKLKSTKKEDIADLDLNEIEELLKVAFKNALENIGIGAKTSSGYGLFKVDEIRKLNGGN